MEEKRCLNCNGTLKLSADRTKWVCDFCESEFYIADEHEQAQTEFIEKNSLPETYFIGSVEVDKDTIQKINSLVATNQKIEAIKYVREISKAGLAEAKNWVDHYQNFDLTKPQDLGKLPQQAAKSGCYVATCVYGSYDCPEVWTLRRFRDTTLATTWYGRAFIKTYYAISPIIVKWFGDTNWFKKMWQGKLDKMVTNLQANGVESTPYEDKNW